MSWNEKATYEKNIENHMVTIGENLKLKKYELIELGSTALKLKSLTNEIIEIAYSDIDKVELSGIKRNTGSSGTMEWGMSNPTFLLPINFLYNLISLFRRQADTCFSKVTLLDGEKIIVLSNRKNHEKMSNILK